MNQLSGSATSPAQHAPTLLSIQVLRGVAALAVTFVHIQEQLVHRYGVAGALPDLSLGFAGVDLFFVISGFIMVYTSERLFGQSDAPRRFFLRRLARIVPLYWLISAILLVYILASYRDLGSANVSYDWMAASFFFYPYPRPNGDLTPLHGVGWTLDYEMFFYAVFAVTLLLSQRRAVGVVCALFAGLVGLRLAVPQLPLPLAFWSDPIILEFVLGLLIALALREHGPLPQPVAQGLVLAGVALFAASVTWDWSDVPRLVKWGCPSALLVAGLTLRGQPVRASAAWRVLGALGDASYALYLVHPLAIIAPRWLLSHLLDPGTAPLTYSAIVLVVAIALAFIVHYLFEQPMTRSLQNVLAHRWPAPIEPLEPKRAT